MDRITVNKEPPHLADVFDFTVPENQTHNALATQFIDLHVDSVRYVRQWQNWIVWDGKRWQQDGTDDVLITQLVRRYCNRLWKEASQLATLAGDQQRDTLRFLVAANKRPFIASVVALAKSDARTLIAHAELDAKPYLLNLQNGTFDLKTGRFRDYDPNDLLTKIADVEFDVNAKCPEWVQTLDLIFDGKQRLIDYVQTVLGYVLAGITDEHLLMIWHGNGNNGKSTIWNAVDDLLGEYSCMMSADLLMPTKNQHPTEKADLFGIRFAPIGEPEQGRRITEGLVKELTGDKKVKARRMYQDNWEFTPTHTFCMSTNHKPRITGTDDGIWRRVKLIPFDVDLSEVTTVDKQFGHKLKSEYPGILNWMIEGWKHYQSAGLIDPPEVTAATADYRQQEDHLGRFVDETYDCDTDGVVTAKQAFSDYQEWGGKMSSTMFGREFATREGIEKHKASHGEYRRQVIYQGIRKP